MLPDRMERVANITSVNTGLERRLRAYPLAFLAALAAAFVITVTTGDGTSTVGGRLGGDFPAFYSAGELVADGHVDDLYDPAAQAARQIELLGDENGFLAFAYAPHVALVYAPLSMLDYQLAYVIHTTLMLAALVGALALMRPMVGLVDRWFALAVAAAVGFYPIFMAVGGGQNTAVSLLLLVTVWRSLRDGEEARAGLAVALLMFRPQYAIPLLGLLFLGRQLIAVGWALTGVAATWTVNALVMGPSWLGDWLHSVGPFMARDADVNGHNAVALVGFLQAVMGSDSTLAVTLGTASGISVAIILAWAWRSRGDDLDVLMALTAVGLVLLSPHTMFYDAGLTLIPLAVLVDLDPAVRWRWFSAAALVAALQPTATALGFSPFAPVVVIIFVVTVQCASRRTTVPLAPTPAVA